MADINQNYERIQKFIAAINRLTNRLSNEKLTAPTLGLAISGGPDSMALLWLMQSFYDGNIFAATIDHGLRQEATQEALHVAKICKELEIKHDILTPEKPIIGNVQSNARKARYALLQQWGQEKGCAYIVTAHHADDQLETMIMRLNRASGLAGLASIRECNGNIIRPLLGFRKSDLIKICEDAQMETINDPSNENDDFDRVKVRKWLAKCDTHNLGTIINPIMAQRSALHLNEANIAIEYSVNILSKDKIWTEGNAIVVDIADLPKEYQIRLLIRALRQIGTDNVPRGVRIEGAVNALNNSIISMIGGIKITPKPDHNNNDKILWILSKAPTRRQS